MMGDSKKDRPVSTYISVKPEYIVAATPPVYRDQKLELYRNSDIAPDGCLYIDTPHPGGTLRQPTIQQANPEAFMLLLRKTDDSGRVLNPATRDNTAVYCSYVRDYAEARRLMRYFEEHMELVRRAHEDEALQAKFWNRSAPPPQPLMDVDERIDENQPPALMDIYARIAEHNRQFAAARDDEGSKPKQAPPPGTPKR